MKSVTFIKLTEKESIAMTRTEEILEELKEHVNSDSGMLEEVELAHRHLINIMCYLEDMGNKFGLPIEEEDEESLADCWEVVITG
jgi:hypothetical protein